MTYPKNLITIIILILSGLFRKRAYKKMSEMNMLKHLVRILLSRNKIIASVIILAALAIILFNWQEISSHPGSTAPDILKILINPIEDANTKLLDYYLNYMTLEEKDICGLPGDPAKAEDAGIVIRGTLKNEYDKDYYIFLSAEAYDSKGTLLGRSLDSGPICGMIAPYVRSNETENFELHLKYYDTISRINLRSGSVSEIPPP